MINSLFDIKINKLYYFSFSAIIIDLLSYINFYYYVNIYFKSISLHINEL